MAKRVIFYLNQFFGGIGGEDKADFAPEFRAGEAVGPAVGIAGGAGDIEVVGTIICGDNFYGQNEDEAREFIAQTIKEQNPSANIVAVDYDPGASAVNQQNRIKLMLANAQK